MEPPKRVDKRLGSKFKLRYQENRVDSPVTWYFEPIGKASYPFFDSEQANVLLDQLFYNPGRGRDQMTFMKSEYGSVTNLHKEKLVLPVVVFLLIKESK